MNFPKKINEYIKDLPYVTNEVGMSDSQVYMFEEYVLKIQPASAGTDHEYEILNWLDGRCPTPTIMEYIKENGRAYILMTKVPGKMLCDEEYMNNPKLLVSLVASALKQLWDVDINECKLSYSRLEERLKIARYNVEHGLVDMEMVEPETFGTEGFANPEELITWLERNRPEEDLVLTHGDMSLPNIFADGDKISGFIDNGKMGPADRWQDLSIALRSLQHNFDGVYTGVVYSGYDSKMLLDLLGMEMDEEKYKYYYLLDELF